MMLMTLWIIFAAMTGAVVLTVLWPLSRRSAPATGGGADALFYRDQMAEIERDLARGLISPAEAETARAEAGRRLLRVSGDAERSAGAEGEPALRRRRAASALALSIVPLLALAVYGAYGAPGLPGRPIATRAAVDPGAMDFAQAVAQIEAHLAKNPDDGRGWEVLAPVYMRAGRHADAAKAVSAAIRALGPSADRLSNLGEALVNADAGVVSAEARAAFEQALALDPANPKTRFYLARTAEQDGDAAEATRRYQALLDESPADAPWRPLVEQRLSALRGSAPEIAALPPAERETAIRGMVEGLDSRLGTNGGSAEEWIRLIRARTVLGERDKAAAALARARQALSADKVALTELDGAAAGLGLEARP